MFTDVVVVLCEYRLLISTTFRTKQRSSGITRLHSVTRVTGSSQVFFCRFAQTDLLTSTGSGVAGGRGRRWRHLVQRLVAARPDGATAQGDAGRGGRCRRDRGGAGGGDGARDQHGVRHLYGGNGEWVGGDMEGAGREKEREGAGRETTGGFEQAVGGEWRQVYGGQGKGERGDSAGKRQKTIRELVERVEQGQGAMYPSDVETQKK